MPCAPRPRPCALELEELRLQLDPHFLFNALNGVAEEIPEHPAAALAMLRDLTAYLRHSLDGINQTVVTVDAEVDGLVGLPRRAEGALRRAAQDTHPCRARGRRDGGSRASCCSRWSRTPSSTAGARTASTSISTSAPRATRCMSRSRTPARSKKARARAGAGPGIGLENVRRRLDLHYPGRHAFTLGDSGKARWWRRSCWRANRAPGPDRRRRASGAPGDAPPAGRASRCRDRGRSRGRGAGPAGDRAHPAAADLPRHRAGRRRRLRPAGGAGAGRRSWCSSPPMPSMRSRPSP